MPDMNVDTSTAAPALPDPTDLVDHEAISAADRIRDSILGSDRDAHRSLKAAREALNEANSAADRAAAGEGDLLVAEHAVTAAELAVRAATRRAAATAAAAAAAPTEHRRQVGLALRHAFFAAIAGRIEACRVHAAALNAAKQAEVAFKTTTAAMFDLNNRGTPTGIAVDNMTREIISEQHERTFWARQHYDLGQARFPGEQA